MLERPVDDEEQCQAIGRPIADWSEMERFLFHIASWLLDSKRLVWFSSQAQ
jgi:hypothetical protein